MKAQKKGAFVWKEWNKDDLRELGITRNESALSKLRGIFIVHANGMKQWERDSDLTADIARANETPLLRRAQMLQ
jgi:hypothetical protein